MTRLEGKSGKFVVKPMILVLIPDSELESDVLTVNPQRATKTPS